MKVSALAILLVGFLSVFQTSHASEMQAREDGASWGNTGAVREPIRDPVRHGHWWWPTVPASNREDAEVWGNRGTVYGRREKPETITATPVPPMPLPPKYACPEHPPGEVILFKLDSTVLDECAQCQIDKVVGYMKRHPKDRVEIVGHTCDLGDEKYNMTLGRRRAEAVLELLAENGVERERMSTKSMGEDEPAVPNDCDENRKLNRRVHFDVTIIEE